MFTENDLGSLISIAEQLVYSRITSDYGEKAKNDLLLLFRTLKSINKYISIDRIEKLVVAIRLSNLVGDYSNIKYKGEKIVDPSVLISHDFTIASIIIERPSEIYLIKQELLDVEKERQFSIVYSYDSGFEKILGKDNETPLQQFEGIPSFFAVPTFKKLENALEYYNIRKARKSDCEFIKKAWFDENRILFKSKPEKHLRRSLHDFLDITLRDAEVREEQNIDDSQPIDIKVSWNYASHIALIEIKWLGKSVDGEGKKFTSQYYDKRALNGSQQLADYLELDKKVNYKKRSIGYLVVFDARRRNTKTSTRSISQEEGLYYSDMDIIYSPNHASTRKDFAQPLRFFIEPICEQEQC